MSGNISESLSGMSGEEIFWRCVCLQCSAGTVVCYTTLCWTAPAGPLAPSKSTSNYTKWKSWQRLNYPAKGHQTKAQLSASLCLSLSCLHTNTDRQTHRHLGISHKVQANTHTQYPFHLSTHWALLSLLFCLYFASYTRTRSSQWRNPVTSHKAQANTYNISLHS